MYDHVRLLRVSMSDASVLLGCVQGADRRKDLRRLTTTLFQHRWCHRPTQMAPNPNPNPNPSPSPNPNQVLPAEGDGT